MLTKLVISLVVGLICLAYVWLAVTFPLARVAFDWHDRDSYTAMGTWLQGVLTPGFLLLAAFTFWLQSQSQSEANKIANRVLLFSNLERFARHLHYRCVAALIGDEPSAEQVTGANFGGLTAMVTRLKGDEGALNNLVGNLVKGRSPVTPTEMYNSPFYKRLRVETEQIVKLGEQVGLVGLLDGRILKIHALIKQYRPK
jgi:hypothetical protein